MSDHPPRNIRNLPGAIARLSSGLTLAEAQSRVDVLVESLKRQFAADYPASSAWTIRLVPLQDTVVGDIRSSLLFVFGAVALVPAHRLRQLANLMLAREHEGMKRHSPGARRASPSADSTAADQSVLLSFPGRNDGARGPHGTRSFWCADSGKLPHLNDISISWGCGCLRWFITSSARAVCAAWLRLSGPADST
jgi:hypothetical protein